MRPAAKPGAAVVVGVVAFVLVMGVAPIAVVLAVALSALVVETGVIVVVVADVKVVVVVMLTAVVVVVVVVVVQAVLVETRVMCKNEYEQFGKDPASASLPPDTCTESVLVFTSPAKTRPTLALWPSTAQPPVSTPYSGSE